MSDNKKIQVVMANQLKPGVTYDITDIYKKVSNDPLAANILDLRHRIRGVLAGGTILGIYNIQHLSRGFYKLI